MRTVTGIFLSTLFLSGCVPLLLAPLAPIAGGAVEASNSFEIDQASVSADLKQALSDAKSIAFIVRDPSVTYVAEYLDAKGAFEVTAEDPPKNSTPSQRRTLMRDICRKTKPDLVLSPSAGDSDAGSGASNVGALLMGRTIVDITYNTEVLRCKDNWTSKFTAVAKLNQGRLNADRAKVSQVLGHEAAKSLMKLAGKEQ